MTSRRAALRPGDGRQLLLGFVALLALAAIAYVAFTSTSGVPWASTYELTAEVENADRLIAHDQVLIGGVRVGQVATVDARPARDGRPPYARLTLHLEAGQGELPINTAVAVRPGAVLGSSYVDLVPGTSRRTIASGGGLPLANARRTVQLNDLLSTFRVSTRRHVQRTLVEVGGAVAGRGPALNALIDETSGLLAPLGRVSATLNEPGTGLGAFLRAGDAASAALAGGSTDLAGLVTGAADTTGGLAGQRPALRAGVRALPGSEAAATIALRKLHPGLVSLADAASDLRPAGKSLEPALRAGSRAVVAGRRPLTLLPAVSQRLGTAAQALRATVRDKATRGTVRKLDELLGHAKVFLGDLMPAQVSCNIVRLWARIGPVFGSLGQGNGPALTQIWFTTAGASGEALQNDRPSSDVAINFQPRADFEECEAGNEPYDGRQVLDNPPSKEPTQVVMTQAPAEAMSRAREAGLLDRLGDAR